jgi:hypothetical protein
VHEEQGFAAGPFVHVMNAACGKIEPPIGERVGGAIDAVNLGSL